MASDEPVLVTLPYPQQYKYQHVNAPIRLTSMFNAGLSKGVSTIERDIIQLTGEQPVRGL